jgi:hypothetical protein
VRRVILESPYAGKTLAEVDANTTYARAAVRDCLLRGDSAWPSHLVFTQPGILRDRDPTERVIGMRAGMAWTAVAEAVVVYTDRGVSPGMKASITRAQKLGLPIEYRTLPDPKECTCFDGSANLCPAHPWATPSPAQLHDLLFAIGHDVDPVELAGAAQSENEIRQAVQWANGEHARAQGLDPGPPARCPEWLEDILDPLPKTKP